ncbi:MAG: hypothetical protein MZV63_32815 [Marinilabiliales bacterium]|nr:hypothetical protein [Marinilabiliales bacterium]
MGSDPNFNNVTAYDGAIFFEGSSIYFGYQANVSYEINDLISVAVGGRYVTAKNTYQGYITKTLLASPATPRQALPGKCACSVQRLPGDYLRAIAANTIRCQSQADTLNGTAAALDEMTRR